MSACYIAQNRMGPLLNIFYPWGIILQGLAIFHFIRRRPDTYWLWIILFGGGLGAAQGGHVSIRNLELGIQQGAVDIDG